MLTWKEALFAKFAMYVQMKWALTLIALLSGCATAPKPVAVSSPFQFQNAPIVAEPTPATPPPAVAPAAGAPVRTLLWASMDQSVCPPCAVWNRTLPPRIKAAGMVLRDLSESIGADGKPQAAHVWKADLKRDAALCEQLGIKACPKLLLLEKTADGYRVVQTVDGLTVTVEELRNLVQEEKRAVSNVSPYPQVQSEPPGPDPLTWPEGRYGFWPKDNKPVEWTFTGGNTLRFPYIDATLQRMPEYSWVRFQKPYPEADVVFLNRYKVSGFDIPEIKLKKHGYEVKVWRIWQLFQWPQ